jgi:hypothetical protein
MSNKDPQILQSCRGAMEKAWHVKISQDSLKRFGQELFLLHEPPVTWNREFHYEGPPARTLAYVFVLDTLNFCFWGDASAPRWTVEYGGHEYNGYWALALSLKRAFEEGIPLWDAGFLSALDRSVLEKVLKGVSVPIPLFEERLANLHELGEGLSRDWQGSFQVFTEHAGGDVLTFVHDLAAAFSSFADEVTYKGNVIRFYKRAQILAGDLAGALEGNRWGTFRNLERLTAFADYKLPQQLRHAGILSYSEGLSRQVDQRILIPPGSEEEVEIRAATIWAIELLRQELSVRGRIVTAMELDWLLWQRSQVLPADMKPYHLTRTVFY